nr:MAG TPA: hypothetical protein [Caudoviricetes sp.]
MQHVEIVKANIKITFHILKQSIYITPFQS